MENSDSKFAKEDVSDPQSIQTEIIIKCPVEEMMRSFFKDYIIIWHDPNVNNPENKQYITRLKYFCKVLTFTEWQKAKDYVQGAKESCHVITSGTNGELLVKEISSNQSVVNIYIFCADKIYHSSWAKKFQKISCVETEIEKVLSQLQQNLLEWFRKASSLKLNLPAFAPIFTDCDKSQMNHLHHYLKILPNFKSREQAKCDFLALSKGIYSDKININLLEEFEKGYNEYNKEQTLRWYTRESFLYKVTNNCLRIASSDSIQYCRLLLKDIQIAIKDQYQTKSKSFNKLMYRAAYLSEEEWSTLKENQGKEIEMHGFLSVSKEEKIALKFLQDPSKMVFITIIVPKGPNEEEQGFAEIEEYSQYPHEKEILFNVRSRFTVLETEDDYIYSGPSKCRHLVLLYGAQGFRKFITEQNPIQEVLIPNVGETSCAHCKQKGLEMAEKLLFISLAGPKNQAYYCKKCVNYGVGPFLCVPMVDKVDKSHTVKIQGCLLMSSNEKQLPFYGYKCCNCQTNKHKSFYVCTDCNGKKWCEYCFEDTLTCMEAGHNIIFETRPFSFWCEGMSANEQSHLKFQNDLVKNSRSIFQQAHVYFQSHEHEKAIEYYKKYIQENEKKKDADLATAYNSLGSIYKSQGKYKEAIQYYLESLDIRIAIFGENHSLVATSFNNLGLVYDNLGEYKEALEFHLKSLGIRRSISGENHSLIAVSYNNVGIVYKNQGDYKKALENYFKSLNIRVSIYGENHPDVALSYHNIGLIYSNRKAYEKALEYNLKSLDIRVSIFGENHPLIANSYNNLGLVFCHQGKHDKALEYHLKALSIRKSVYRGDNHPDVASSYNNLAHVYRNQGKCKIAQEYYLKSLGIRKSVFGENHPLVAASSDNVVQISKSLGEPDKEL